MQYLDFLVTLLISVYLKSSGLLNAGFLLTWPSGPSQSSSRNVSFCTYGPFFRDCKNIRFWTSLLWLIGDLAREGVWLQAVRCLLLSLQRHFNGISMALQWQFIKKKNKKNASIRISRESHCLLYAWYFCLSTAYLKALWVSTKQDKQCPGSTHCESVTSGNRYDLQRQLWLKIIRIVHWWTLFY